MAALLTEQTKIGNAIRELHRTYCSSADRTIITISKLLAEAQKQWTIFEENNLKITSAVTITGGFDITDDYFKSKKFGEIQKIHLNLSDRINEHLKGKTIEPE